MDCYAIRRVESIDELLRVWDVIAAQIARHISDADRHIYDLRRFYPTNRHLMLLIEYEDRIIGGALGHGNTLRALGIEAEHRGRGLGRRLVQVFEFSAMKSGLRMVCLGAHAEAKGFYVRMGYHGKKSMMKEFPLPGRVLELKLRRLETAIGDLESGHVVTMAKSELIPALSMTL